MSPVVLQTERLLLRELSEERDAGFILALLNDADFIRFIGDKEIRDEDAARRYLRDGPLDSYGRYGYGLWLVELRDDGQAAGICGLVNRDGLDDVDIGFGFLPAYRSRGLACESARAVLDYGITQLQLPRIVAITDPGNQRSIDLLEKIGLKFERMIHWPADASELRLFACGSGEPAATAAASRSR